MKRETQKRYWTKRDAETVRATFFAISSAMGWDRECPVILESAVLARVLHRDANIIAEYDDVVTKFLNPDDVDVPSSITDPKDSGRCDPLRGKRMDSADCGEN